MAVQPNRSAATTWRDSKVVSLFVRFLPAILLPLVLVALWELLPHVTAISRTILPPPSLVATRLFDLRDTALEHTLATLKETAVGFSASVVLAAVVAVIMDQIIWVRRGLYPLLVASQTIPIIAIAPLVIIWFGFGLFPKVVVIVLVTFFPIVVATLDGFASAEREALNLLRTMGASKRQIFRYVRLPTALPYFFTGVRISVTYAVVAAIFSEYVGAYQGLGIWMQLSKARFDTDLLFGAILISAMLSIALFLLAGLIARLTIPWYYAQRIQSS